MVSTESKYFCLSNSHSAVENKEKTTQKTSGDFFFTFLKCFFSNPVFFSSTKKSRWVSPDAKVVRNFLLTIRNNCLPWAEPTPVVSETVPIPEPRQPPPGFAEPEVFNNNNLDARTYTLQQLKDWGEHPSVQEYKGQLPTEIDRWNLFFFS